MSGRVDASMHPRLPAGVRLRFDPVRATWVLLAPERVLFPDDVARAVLERCDGARDVDAIVADLAGQFDAPAQTIREDVIGLLEDLVDKALVDL